MSCSLDEIHHHKDLMTDLTNTWIFALWRAPVLSKLKKARKAKFIISLAEEERQNFPAAA